MCIFFLILCKFSAIISSFIFSEFFSLFSFWDPYNVNDGAFNVVSEVSQTALISFYPFFLILFNGSDFHQFVSQFTYSFFCLIYLLLIPSSVFFISVIVHLSLFFKSSSFFIKNFSYLLGLHLYSFINYYS